MGLIITGLAPPESEFDFFSRSFYPKLGIKEVICCHLVSSHYNVFLCSIRQLLASNIELVLKIYMYASSKHADQIGHAKLEHMRVFSAGNNSPQHWSIPFHYNFSIQPYIPLCSISFILQDPVGGAVHCSLAPYWSQKLGKCDLLAYVVIFPRSSSLLSSSSLWSSSYWLYYNVYFVQASPRGGLVDIHLDEQNQRVLLRGKAIIVMEGCVLV